MATRDPEDFGGAGADMSVFGEANVFVSGKVGEAREVRERIIPAPKFVDATQGKAVEGNMPADPPDAETLLRQLAEKATARKAPSVVATTFDPVLPEGPGPETPPQVQLTAAELDAIIGGVDVTELVQATADGAAAAEVRAQPAYAAAVEATAKKLAEAADGGGLRLNAGKTRIDLIPPEWIWALADVLTMGCIKYAARNWERGMDWSNMVGCWNRHDLKFIMGERYDDETGCHHLAMAAWNNLALMSYDIRSMHTGKPVGNNDLPALGVELLKFINSGNPTNPKIRAALGLDPL